MSGLTAEDSRWLDAAARYAAPLVGTTADNPCVAALVVDPATQALVSRAVTARGGRPHAEAQALQAAGFEAAGATLYVTLEPCHHWGRTPPCVDAVIRSGVMRVVVGALDVRTPGESVARLESAGIEVVVADHAGSAALHAGHSRRHVQGRPLVTIAALDRSVRDVPAVGAAFDVLRSRADAILIDAATARRNEPEPAITLAGLQARTPLRVIVSDGAPLGRNVNLIGGFSGYRTAIIAETDAEIDAPVSVEVIRIEASEGGADLHQALAALARKGIQTVLVEAGGDFGDRLLEAGLVDRAVVATTTGAAAEEGPFASLGETGRQLHEGAQLIFYGSATA